LRLVAGGEPKLEGQRLLPSNLLVVSKRKGEILPRYAKLTPENLEVAHTLIEIYKSHTGEKKKVLRVAAAKLEDQGFEYRFVRGLSLLLERRSVFIFRSKIDPVEVRMKVFHTVEKMGVPFNSKKREEIIESVASKTGLISTMIEELLYADLDEELLLEKFDPPSPLSLLQQYNLSLTQTLLFDAVELSFKSAGNWQQIFYSIKKLGLIYEAYKDKDFWVKVDGPISLFKLTKRYGINIAKLLPLIINNQEWSLNAKILWKYTNEYCNLTLDSRKHSLLLPKFRAQQLTYDSATEKTFASQFQALKTGWTLKREPEPVLAGTGVIVPDFSLERSGLKVYLEIVGFWTEEYLLRKAEKLKHVQEKMLLLVDEALACEKLIALEKRPQLYFIYYRNDISLAPILRYLEKAFEEIKAKEIKFLTELQVKFTEPIVLFAEFAQRVGVSVESVQTLLTATPPKDYLAMPNSIISKEKLVQLNNVLEERLLKSGKLMLSEAIDVIESKGVSDASCILSGLGYKIVWRGLDSEKAEIYKNKS
jgi:uncharacterized protein